MKKQMIIFEQPDNSGKWKKIPPPFKGKIDTNKNDVSNDGNWYKPKEDHTNSIDDTWNTITDSELLKKIKTGGEDFWKKITQEIPSLIVKAGKYVYKKGEDLEKFWENYKKQNNNTLSNNINWLKDPTGSKMYVYKVEDCKWLAKNTKTGKIFIISDNPKYQVSVDILDKSYPEEIKNCKKQMDNNQSNETTPQQQTVTLPEWATCIGLSIVGTIPTLDDKNVKIVMSPFGQSNGFFWEDKTFIFVSKDGTKIEGVWSCDGNDLTIKTKDGEQWNKKTQWVKQISKSLNPDVNYQDYNLNLSDTTAKEFYDLPDESSVEKSSTESNPKNVEPPKEPVQKPEIDKNQMKTESISNNLEKVLMEFTSLMDKLETKEIIKEQTESQVKAPGQELDILYNNSVLKSIGPVVSLCINEQGDSLPVNVGGKIYFAGRRTILNDNLNGGEGFYVYDGRILKKGQGCNYSVVQYQGRPVRISGIEPTLLELPMKNVLSRFGINTSMYESNPYYYIDQITKKFRSLIEKGARSTFFGLWQDLLMNFYKYGPKEKRLDFMVGKNSQYDPMKDELGNYNKISADNIGIRYLNKDIVVYMPKGAGVTTPTTGAKYSSGSCRQDLISYLVGAFDYERNGTNNTNINNSAVRENIRGCNNSGEYENLAPVTQEDFDKLGVKLGKDLSPFKGMFTGFGNKLSFDNIKKLLSGKTKKLPQVGRYRNNPYLPFNIENRPGTFNESELKVNIKKNLMEMSNEKKSRLLAEKKIVQTRTNILLENRILKFKEPREKFFNELISELNYLEKQKFNKRLIKEEFWGKIKGLFGDNGSEAIFGTFKDYMSNWLVGKLTSVNPNGWMGMSIKNSIKNIHVDDIDKLTDCNFMTKRISSSITDEILNKVKNDEKIDGGISKIVKGGLTKSIDRTELLRSIEEGVSNIICSELGNVENKLRDKAEEMKLKAIKP